MHLNQSTKVNAKILANANALISKTLERTEALPNKLDTDRSLDSPESEQSLAEVQQIGHMLLSTKISKMAQQG